MGRTSDARERLMDAVLELIWRGSYGSTTIDGIRQRAGVRKGSFYYFFPSKAALAAAALERDWTADRAQYDARFASHIPPLERLENFAALALEHQRELLQRYGVVVGCPLFALGSELNTQEPELRAKLLEIMEHHRLYLESAIRDGHALGLLHAPDAELRSRELWAVTEGMLTQARISNELSILESTWPVMKALLRIADGAVEARHGRGSSTKASRARAKPKRAKHPAGVSAKPRAQRKPARSPAPK